jgi:hypothetical protein
MKHPWRFQGDMAGGESDPVVTMISGESVAHEDAVKGART